MILMLLPLAILLVVSFASMQHGQIMIFNTNGNVMLIRGKTEHKQIRGMEMLPGDQVRIQNGTVTLVNRSEKRVSLTKSGTYSYQQVQKMMKQATASASNRYFVYVWESMQGKDRKAQVVGGVVRGEPFTYIPSDSARVISDTIAFYWPNPAGIRQVFTLTDNQGNTLYSDTLQDSCLLVTKQKLQMINPGNYWWQVTDGFSKPHKHRILNPHPSEAADLQQDFNKHLNDFGEVKDTDLEAVLILQYMREKKVYKYPYPLNLQ